MFPMPPALELIRVTKRFAAGAGTCFAYADAFRSVDLEVLEGEAVAIVGAAGTGKSALLFCAAGLLVPDSGFIRWFGSTDRSVAAARVSYITAAATTTGRRPRPRAPRQPHIHLIDDPERLTTVTLERLRRWTERRRSCGDAVVIATRDAALEHGLAQRVIILGMTDASRGVRPRAARVAERAAGLVPEGGSM